MDDKVKLLLGGAADYLTKPFEIPELLARIQVQLRKEASPLSPVLRAGTWSWTPPAAKSPWRHTRPPDQDGVRHFEVTSPNPGQAVAKSVILERISLDTPDCTEYSLKQHVSNLRKKLREAGDKEYIQAVWGIGFRLDGKGVEKS